MSARWRLRTLDPRAVRHVARENGVPELVARVLVARGHRGGEATAAHLSASLSSLFPPELLPGMDAAGERVARARERRETVLVHGDYDVDGVTGTALLLRLFALLGVRAVPYIPNRLTDGYSFGAHSVAKAREVGATVVISVDNGTSARETIGELAALGIDTIVTDHHEPPLGELPAAVAIVNPKLQGSRYPFRELCGSGVAFKLAWGIAQRVSGARKVPDDLRAFLLDAMAYVAIATVCDVVPLVSENRTLARRGLAALGATKQAGMAALIDACGLRGQPLAAEDVGFKLGPRLNAAGRLGSAARALELLVCEDPARARALAGELEVLNAERRRIEAEITAEAWAQAEAFADAREHPFLVLASARWHAGVVGIVAARVAQRFQRPALVIALDGDSGRGSARSVAGFDVLAALHGGARHMLRYGGHAQAAGCEVLASRIGALRAALCEATTALRGGVEPSGAALWIDGEVALEHLDDALMRELDRLEPFGPENEKPCFVTRDVRLAEAPRRIGDGGAHLLLRLRRGERVLKALAFGMGARAGELSLGAPLAVVHTPRWSYFRGARELELTLTDFRVGAAPELELV
jgi:single-stranded-DNA-specific exonuclease